MVWTTFTLNYGKDVKQQFEGRRKTAFFYALQKLLSLGKE